MKRTELEDIVMTQLSETLGVSLLDLNMGKMLTTDIGADELDLVLLIMDFENNLHIELADADVEQVMSWRVGTLVDYLYKHVKD